MIHFFTSGDPKGQPRPRAFAMKVGGGKYSARVFDAGTAEGWKSAIAFAAREHKPAEPIDGPVAVSAYFYFRRPQIHYIGGNKSNDVKEGAPEWHTSKPDADNCAKALLDALTQMGGFWNDDAQVCSMRVYKGYGLNPGVFVTIESAPSSTLLGPAVTMRVNARRKQNAPAGAGG